MNQIEKAAAILGQKGGERGFGACKRRSTEHYRRMAELSWEGKRVPLADRFWKQVEKRGPNDCWPWVGCTVNGYGRINIKRKSVLAHRVAWELSTGKSVPEGVCLLHKCDNPPCCNPAHHFLGSRLDNMNDKVAKGRAAGPKGEAHASHKLTEDDVRQIRHLSGNGFSNARLADQFGVTKSTISHAVTRRYWKHI